MNEDGPSEYCRQQGLHADQIRIEAWRKACLPANAESVPHSQSTGEVAALLVLQKSQGDQGEGEDE